MADQRGLTVTRRREARRSFLRSNVTEASRPASWLYILRLLGRMSCHLRICPMDRTGNAARRYSESPLLMSRPVSRWSDKSRDRRTEQALHSSTVSRNVFVPRTLTVAVASHIPSRNLLIDQQLRYVPSRTRKPNSKIVSASWSNALSC